MVGTDLYTCPADNCPCVPLYEAAVAACGPRSDPASCEAAIEAYNQCRYKATADLFARLGYDLDFDCLADLQYKYSVQCPPLTQGQAVPARAECCIYVGCNPIVFGIAVHCFIMKKDCYGRVTTYEKWQNKVRGSHVLKTPGANPRLGFEHVVDVYLSCFPCEPVDDGFWSPLCNCITKAVHDYPSSGYYGSVLTDFLIPDLLADFVGIPSNLPFSPNSNTFVQDVIDECEDRFMDVGGVSNVPKLPGNAYGSGPMGIFPF